MMLLWSSLLWCLFRMVYCAPIPLEMVDMSHTLNNDTLHWPSVKGFEINVITNGTQDEGYWLQLEEFNSGTHVGTHMDAPCHFVKGRWTVDEIPLNRLIAPAAVVDITSKVEEDRDYLVTIQDLEEWETKSQHSLNGMIILLKSGWGQRWGDQESFTGTPNNDPNQLHFPGMSEEASRWLVDNRSIIGLGTETMSLDHGPSHDFMAHRVLLDANIYGLESVANVDKLPLIGATLHVMPMKIGRASGAPTRIIATYPKVLFHGQNRRSVTERSLREVITFS